MIRIALLSCVGLVLGQNVFAADYAWQRTDKYVAPDFVGFFPDDPAAGELLDDIRSGKVPRLRWPEEYLQAVNLHHKKNHRVVKLMIYIALATAIVLLGTDFSNTRDIMTNILAAFFSISFYMLFVRMLSAYQAKSVYQKSAILPHEVTLHISGKGIKLDKNTKGTSIPWSAFSKWKNDEYFYLLYTNPRRFNVIPTRAMSEAEKKEFDAYLEKYIPQG